MNHPQGARKEFVLCHPKKGIFLHSHLTTCWWSISYSAGYQAAPTFSCEEGALLFIDARCEDVDLSGVTVRPVMVQTPGLARVEELDRAGLGLLLGGLGASAEHESRQCQSAGKDSSYWDLSVH